MRATLAMFFDATQRACRKYTAHIARSPFYFTNS